MSRLHLRPFKPCDAAAVASWFPDERSFRLWSADRYDCAACTADAINRQYAGAADNPCCWPMTVFDEQGVAGHLMMRYTDDAHTTLRFGFVAVDAARRGQHLGSAMLRLALRYAFELAGAEQVTLGVFSQNEPARRCYEAVGFRLIDDQPGDICRLLDEDWLVLEMAITRSEWVAMQAYAHISAP